MPRACVDWRAAAVVVAVMLAGVPGTRAAKNRGWLEDSQVNHLMHRRVERSMQPLNSCVPRFGQLVRGSKPVKRSGYGLAVVSDLSVIFGGDMQGSKCTGVKADL